MQLLPLIGGTHIQPIAEDTKNVCNAALSLLFTLALIIWGFVFNRRRAWRTDGGTAAFGVGAIILAMISTTLNFMYIPKQDQYAWMPKLTWSVVLWQSFLGWWWWAGSGMGIRETEEMLIKEQKRQQKRKLRAQRRKEQKERAKTVWKGVTNAFKPGTGSTVRKRHLDGESSDASHSHGSPRPTAPRAPRSFWTVDSASTATGLQGPSQWTHPIQAVQRWYARLRHDHFTAAHLQAVERVERIQQMYGREDRRNSTREPGSQVVGWGLGSYGLREAGRERMEDGEEAAGPSGSRVEDGEGEDVWRIQDKVVVEEDNESFASSDEETVHDEGTGRESVHLRRWDTGDRRTPSQLSSTPARRQQQDSDDAVGSGGSSMWWWGPLRKWRLQDSTTYR